MIKDELDIKAFYKGKEVKIIELHHLGFFYSGLTTLATKWKVKPFDVLMKDVSDETTQAALNIMIGLIYKDMCTKSGPVINLKKFKNEMLLKNKKPKVFLMESDYLKIPDNDFDNGMGFLKKIGFIGQDTYHNYIAINNSIMDYCRKLGNYLFNTWYCQESFKRNTHYFGDHNSYDHYRASQERKQISNKTLN
jgi:hypothetical protein